MEGGNQSLDSIGPLEESVLTLGANAKRLVAERKLKNAKNATGKVVLDPKIAEARYDQLKEAFTLIDKDNNGTLSVEEILQFLRSINADVNPMYVQEIHSSLDRNGDGAVSIEEFIQGYLDQVNQITEAIEDLRHTITIAKEETALIEKRLEQTCSRAPGQNDFGVPSGSKLTVLVREAQNLPTGLFSLKTYAELDFEHQKIRTNVLPGSNPVWNESFEFLAERLTSHLHCKIMRKDAISSDEILGECEITLEELNDQRSHDLWKQLNSSGKTGLTAKVMVSAQLLYDEPKLYREQIERMQMSISSDEVLLFHLNQKLTQLGTSPIGMFTRDSLALRLESRVFDSMASLGSSYLNVRLI